MNKPQEPQHTNNIEPPPNPSLSPLSTHKPTNTHQDNDEASETQTIKTLRQDQNMTWSAITTHLNQARSNRGVPPILTTTAIYSRFVRATPKTATPVAEIGFDAKDYMHLRNPGQTTGPAAATSKVGKKRVKNYENAKELEANVRRQVGVEDAIGELESVEKTVQLVRAVERVERNFWVLVADEMERMTASFYPPEALAGRFRNI